jgi:uncharacterized protein YihD (DUF1040 family)
MHKRAKDRLRSIAWDRVVAQLSEHFRTELGFDTLAPSPDLSRTESQTLVRIGTLVSEHDEYDYLLAIIDADEDTHEIGRISYRIALEVCRDLGAEREATVGAAVEALPVSQNYEGRDPERIDIVLEEIRKYWVKHPDYRLSQIIGNAAANAGYPTGGYGMEDDTLLNNLAFGPSSEFAFAGGRPRPIV